MPRGSRKSTQRSQDSDEDDGPSQSQSQRRGKGPQKKRAREEDDASQQASQRPQDKLTGDELDRKVSETVRYLLFSDRKKVPVKRADITKNVLKEHGRAFPQVMEQAKKQLQKVFGIEVEEIESAGKTKAYILIDSIECEQKDDLVEWGEESPKIGLLMVILSIIFMSGNVITEAQLWDTLKKLGLQQKSEHPIFGDPDKLLSQEFTRQGYLERKKLVGDEASYEYRWGQRSYKETSKMKVLEFVAKVHNVDATAWTSQMKEIQEEQEQENMEEE